MRYGDALPIDSERAAQDVSDNILANMGLVERPEEKPLSMLAFTQATYRGYQPDPMHELIASALDEVVAGNLKRLMIMAPPQHGKSQLVSVQLPAYHLAVRPEDSIILASYASTLAEDKSREIRQLITEDPVYHSLFPDIALRYDSRSVDHWRLSQHRGQLVAAGVRTRLTGYGAMLGIIDDPHADWQEAQSPTMREAAYNWYRSVFNARMRDNGAIVIICTRWHKQDLPGLILENEGKDWEVIRLPALCESQEERDRNNVAMGLGVGLKDPLDREEGDPVAPQRFSQESLLSKKKTAGKVIWTCVYQQSPRDADGNRFQRAWFKITDALPVRCRFIRYWDKAASESDGSCFTAGVLVAHSREGDTYIVDVVKGRWSARQREVIIKQTAQLDAQKYGQGMFEIWLEQEPGSGGKESAESTVRNLAGFRVFAEPATGSKDVRLEPFAAQCEGGNVYLIAGAWNEAFIEECLSIPNGDYRDQTDAAGGAFNRLTLRKKKSRGRLTSLVANRKIAKPQPFGNGELFKPVSGDFYERAPHLMAGGK